MRGDLDDAITRHALRDIARRLAIAAAIILPWVLIAWCVGR